MLVFLEQFGTRAVELGWADRDSFSAHAQHGTIRSDYCGALVITASPAESINADRMASGI